MTGRRRFYLALVGWLSIVAVGSTLVWTVVAQAGRDVGEPDRDTLAASSGTEATSTVSESPTASDVASPAQPTGSGQPSASVSASETASETATETPTDTDGPPVGSPSPSSDPQPDDDPTPSTSPPPQSHRRTWQGTAGRIIASCAGAKISLVAAQPNSGWRVEVEERGPEEVSVKFELTEEEEEDDRIAARSAAGEVFDEIVVHARCSGGVPSFSVDS